MNGAGAGLALSITLGDVVVAGTVTVSVVVAYYALRDRIRSVVSSVTDHKNATNRLIQAFEGRMDAHAEKLKTHTASLSNHGQRIAGLEGRVFNRRITDHVPPTESEGSDL